MGAHPLRRCTFVGGTHFLPKTDTRARVVTGTRRQLHAYQIGLGFIFAAELEVDQVRALHGHRVGQAWVNAQIHRCECAANLGQGIGGHALAHALASVFAQRVGDFVSHDHGDLIVGEVQLVQNAVKESDLAPRHTKRIDLV